MKNSILYLFKLVIILSLQFTLIFYCRAQMDSGLDFNAPQHPTMNVITISLSHNQVDKVHVPLLQDDKLEFNDVPVKVNNFQTNNASVKVRGQTSLGYRRKSYTIKLSGKGAIYGPVDTFRIKKIYAISLSMDRDYVRNAIAYDVLYRDHLCIPDHCFGTLNLNDSSEGIYMLCYPPQDYVVDELGATLVLRRRYHENTEIKESDHLSTHEVKILRKKFTEVYSRMLNRYHGRQLYDSLSARIDMKNYFDWLIFNYLFKNGDYTDEVYFYWSPERKIYDIIPWDFDDLFMNYPHEGNIVRKKDLRDKLLFSLEDKLDVAIAGDPYLYSLYIKEFDNFLNSINSQEVKSILEDIYGQLVPYYMNPEIIQKSNYDKYRLTNLALLKSDLKSIYQLIMERMKTSRDIVDEQLKESGI